MGLDQDFTLGFSTFERKPYTDMAFYSGVVLGRFCTLDFLLLRSLENGL